MNKKDLQTKVVATVATMSMITNLCPLIAFGAEETTVAKDGVYKATSHVTNNPKDENVWTEYDVEVSLTIENGKFTDITVKPTVSYDESVSYFNKAVNKSKGLQTKLIGQDATKENVSAWDVVSGATRTSEAVKEAATNAIDLAFETNKTNEKIEYVMMNIPYDEFYSADVKNDVKVDAFTSATLSKTKTGTLSGGSYHVNSDGSDITGITFPVKVADGVDLSQYNRVTDSDVLEITTTNRGQTSTTTYKGVEALYENPSYSYYVLEEEPSYYKELSIDEDGKLVFGKTVGEITTLSDISVDLETESSYGDYQLSIEGWNDINLNSDKVYAVIVSTDEGNDYGMRHLENIWRVTELAWCTGFTSSVHNCPTSSAHYEKMMGQHINKITYYTSKGIYAIPVDSLYVPVQFESDVTVENASVNDGETIIDVTSLPSGYEAEYSVEGLTDVKVSENKLTYALPAEKGNYTLNIKDKSGKYADVNVKFSLYTEDMPAEYDNENYAIKKANGYLDDEFAEYVSNISSVSVNGKNYASSGKGATVLINSDGTLVLEAVPFSTGDKYDVVVFSTGYKNLSFSFSRSKDMNEDDNGNGNDNSGDNENDNNDVNNNNANNTESDNNDVNNNNANNTESDNNNVNNNNDNNTESDNNDVNNNSTNDAENLNNSANNNLSDTSQVKTGDKSGSLGVLGLAIVSMGLSAYTLARKKEKNNSEQSH